MSNILLMEDEQSTLSILTTVLKTEGYSVVSVPNISEAAEPVSSGGFTLMIADIERCDQAQIAECAELPKVASGLALIVLAGEDQDIAPLAENEVFAVIRKPLKMDGMLAWIQKAMDYSEGEMDDISSFKNELETSYQYEEIVSESAAMRSVCDMIDRIAGTDVAVLISGETGTGKELVAHTIHGHSLRKEKEFVSVDCWEENPSVLETILFGKGTEPGAFEKADGGSVFLSGLDSLPPELQMRLLEVLKDRCISRIDSTQSTGVDVRFLASAGAPDEAVRSGRLNAELYSLLRAIMISIPALRDRSEDITPTMMRILHVQTPSGHPVPSVRPEAVELLAKYRWPGNVGQLEEVVKHALEQSSGVITVENMPAYIQTQD